MRVHFLGIGGSGASAAAAIAQTQGFKVTGCDLNPHNEFTGIFKPDQLLTGHNPEHLSVHVRGVRTNIDVFAVTPAIFSLDPSNPELLEAKKKGIPIMTWQEFLGKYLTKEKFVIAVCGTHGKTTTTAMIAKILEDAGLDPTVELGAIIPWWGTNYRIGKGKYFVVEADEFNDNFLPTKPDIAVVTNIEMDHPEYFKDFEAVKTSFKKFLLQTKETIVANLKDPGIQSVIASTSASLSVNSAKQSSSEENPNQIATSSPSASPRNDGLEIIDFTKNKLSLNLKVPGTYNILNASAAFQVGLLLNIDPSKIKKSLESYTGVSKRFEYIGEFRGAKVYSDFGHHPTEIEKTMEAVREKFPKERILLIYQPHMFSRTKALFDDFVKVFQKVPTDKTFIMDIYPSREINTGLVTSQQLVKAVKKPSVSYLGGVKGSLEKIKPEIRKGDIVFFMSAGDTDKLAKKLAG